MKNSYSFLAFIILIGLSSFSCNLFCESGSGRVDEETRNLAQFAKIDLDGIGKVVLYEDTVFSVKIVADDNIIPLIETEIRRNTLVLNTSKCVEQVSKLEYHIYSNNLQGIEMSGAGEVSGKYKITAEKFEIEVSGSGKMNLYLEVQELETEVSGSGQVELSGNATAHEIEIGGAGKLEAFKLVNAKADVSMSGSGLCEINVTQSLKAKVGGSGDVVYKGSPNKVDTDIRGSGKIRTR